MRSGLLHYNCICYVLECKSGEHAVVKSYRGFVLNCHLLLRIIRLVDYFKRNRPYYRDLLATFQWLGMTSQAGIGEKIFFFFLRGRRVHFRSRDPLNLCTKFTLKFWFIIYCAAPSPILINFSLINLLERMQMKVGHRHCSWNTKSQCISFTAIAHLAPLFGRGCAPGGGAWKGYLTCNVKENAIG